jgi:hypothetical protein
MTQLALRIIGKPVEVDLGDVRKQPTGAAAIALCAMKSGKLDKILAADIGAQEAVWSRIQTTGKGFSLEQLSALMDSCGNEAPLHWLLMQRGWDPTSLRQLESEQRIAELEAERAVTVRLLREVRA